MTNSTAPNPVSDDSERVSDALVHYYRNHGLPLDGGANDPWFRVHIGRFSIPLPNPPGRRRAVLFHDVNHLATGYDTTFSSGEMSIAAFEVAAGCGPFPIVWFINLSMFALGLIACPRSVFAAFVRGRRAASIYERGDPAALAAMSVRDVRALLLLDQPAATAQPMDVFHFIVWALIAVLVFVAPAAMLFVALWSLFHVFSR